MAKSEEVSHRHPPNLREIEHGGMVYALSRTTNGGKEMVWLSIYVKKGGGHRQHHQVVAIPVPVAEALFVLKDPAKIVGNVARFGDPCPACGGLVYSTGLRCERCAPKG